MAGGLSLLIIANFNGMQYKCIYEYNMPLFKEDITLIKL